MKATYTLMLQGEEQDVDFEIEADITYQPARISGPPEDCYPDESECDITEIKVMSQIDGLKNADILDALATQVGDDTIINDLWEDYMLDRESSADDRADQINDERKLAGG